MKKFKFIKTFERFAPAPATKPDTAPRPAPTTVPEPPVRPEKPVKPEAPGKPITTPSIDPGPLAVSEDDVLDRLKMELNKRGETLAEFVKKNKKK